MLLHKVGGDNKLGTKYICINGKHIFLTSLLLAPFLRGKKLKYMVVGQDFKINNEKKGTYRKLKVKLCTLVVFCI